MKFSAALSLAIAPLAIAKAVHNVYPVRRDPSKHKSIGRQEGVGVGSSGILVDEAILAASGLTLGSANEIIVLWVNGGGGAATTTINAQQTVTRTITETAGAGAGAAATGEAQAQPPPVEGGAASNTLAAPGAGATGGAAVAGALTHQVTLGGPKGLQFEPNQITAAVGDMVVFTFLSQNHTATQSAFDKPCEPLSGGMDSGFQANANNSVNPPPQIAMQVMVATPLWFYCRQNNHCGKGMTFSINPTAEKTQALFQSMAIAQAGAGSGSAITGNGGGAPAAEGGAASSAAPAAGESLTATLGSGAGSAAPTATLGEPGAVGTGAVGSNGVATGSGTIQPDGTCICSVQCNMAGAFPAVQAQGAGAFGGMPGALPANMVAVK